MWWFNEPRLTVGQRQEKAKREAEKLSKNGKQLSPVVIEGRKITTTFWGNAWCNHLMQSSDYSNRLPRGRSYCSNGSVIDLQIDRGQINALVSGSSVYKVKIEIAAIKEKQWEEIVSQCTGKIGSLIELVEGKLSDEVMKVVTHPMKGLFPRDEEIQFKCSCPDSAYICKHIAAAFYGIGNRLDKKPELLFHLRGADHLQLIAKATTTLPNGAKSSGKTVSDDLLSEVFGVEFSEVPAPEPAIVVAAKKAAVAKTKKVAPVEPTLKATVKAKPTRTEKLAATKAALKAKPTPKATVAPEPKATVAPEPKATVAPKVAPGTKPQASQAKVLPRIKAQNARNAQNARKPKS